MAFESDWQARVNHPYSQQVFVNRGDTLPRIPPAPKAKDVGVGEVASGKDWQVTAAVAEHCQTYLDSLAYRVDTPEGSVIFTGDTQHCDTVRDLARDADMMLCMCWGEQSVMETTNEAKGQCGTTGRHPTCPRSRSQETGPDPHRPQPRPWHPLRTPRGRNDPHVRRRDYLFRRVDAD